MSPTSVTTAIAQISMAFLAYLGCLFGLFKNAVLLLDNGRGSIGKFNFCCKPAYFGVCVCVLAEEESISERKQGAQPK